MTTSEPPGNPWEALQRPGIAATDIAPGGITPAFAAGDEAGFDRRLALPSVCLKCGTDDGVDFVDDWMERHQVGSRALRILRALGRFRYAPIRPSHGLRVPLCAHCAARWDRAQQLMLALALTPVWVVVGIVGIALIGGSVADVGAGLLLLAVLVLAWVALTARARAAITIAVDDEGYVKLAGIHPLAGEAIVNAQPRQAPLQ